MLRSVYSGQNSWFAPLSKLFAALKQRGVGGVFKQLYVVSKRYHPQDRMRSISWQFYYVDCYRLQIGDLKFGELKGEDKHGNRYYENVNLPYGQHR
jgi:hypothetical protein